MKYFHFFFLLLFTSCSTIWRGPANISFDKAKQSCAGVVNNFLKWDSSKYDKFEDIEIVHGKEVSVIDASIHRLNQNSKYYSFPSNFNLSEEVLILFDENGHSSILAGGKEFHGHVLNESVLVRDYPYQTHKADFIIRLKNLSTEQITSILIMMDEMKNSKTLTCFNAIEHLLFHGAGLKFKGERTSLGFHPQIEQIFSEGLVGPQDQLVEQEIYSFRRLPIKNLVARLHRVKQILEVGSVLTIPSWIKIALNPDQFLVYNPKWIKPEDYIENFSPDISDEKLLIRNIDLDQQINLDLRSSDLKELRDPTLWENMSTPARVAWNWIHSTLHNAWGAYHVINLMALKKLKHGLIEENHPWITGFIRGTEDKIYSRNIVFASTAKNSWLKEPGTDEEIANRVGHYLGSMTKKSTGPEEIPHGPTRRMPHVVNYLHGSVAYNGVSLIFNDFKDAMFHLSDPVFIKDLYKMVKAEKREFYLIFREREYNPEEYAFFLGFIRSHLKWYANANGPKDKVLYGAHAAYPVVNVINGNWVRDMYSIRNGITLTEEVVRNPVEESYFSTSYQGHSDNYNLADQALAYFNYLVLKPRGFQGGLVFTPRERIEPEKYLRYQQAIENGEEPPPMIYPISNPFKPKED